MNLSQALAEATEEIGVSSLKLKQVEAIYAFVEGNDVSVSLPTGYGKSLIYAILQTIFKTKLKVYYS